VQDVARALAETDGGAELFPMPVRLEWSYCTQWQADTGFFDVMTAKACCPTNVVFFYTLFVTIGEYVAIYLVHTLPDINPGVYP
jgi:hypothetical protein